MQGCNEALAADVSKTYKQDATAKELLRIHDAICHILLYTYNILSFARNMRHNVV